MRIQRIESWSEEVPLRRPYTITSGTTDRVELFFVRIVGDKEIGLGSGVPIESITGESLEACRSALVPERLAELIGRDTREFGARCADVARLLPDTPAARSAVDIALHDLFARELGVSLCNLLGGRRLHALPTSITIGIQPTETALQEVDEYLGRGFTNLKVKIGTDLEEDIDRLRSIRARAGSAIGIRVDGNQGYDLAGATRLARVTRELKLELVEQPLHAAAKADFPRLPAELRAVLALDESLHGPKDALEHARDPELCATYVIKLMKCGGLRAAGEIACIAEAAGRNLMWGCMDESAISIAAALHAAYATPATAYLDLDGNFDLARDPAEGGFRIVDGKLELLDRPGLGVSLRE